MSADPDPLPTTCAACGKTFAPGDTLMLCDEAPASAAWHDSCFDETPCGRGEHGEGCPTTVLELGGQSDG